MELNHLSSRIIKAAINVHKVLGPGLLESVYQSAMPVELRYMKLDVQSVQVIAGIGFSWGWTRYRNFVVSEPVSIIGNPPRHGSC